MFSLFKKKKSILYSPTSGTLIPLSQVNDPVFSQGMMGPGFAVSPTIDEIYSPVSGTITSVFPTKHAIGITSEDGKSLLLHIGIDTVELNGEGFDIFVTENQKVTKDTLLAKVNRSFLKEKGKEDTLMVLFPEEKMTLTIEEKSITAHETILELEK